MASWLKIAAAAVASLALLAGPSAAQVPDPFARELAQKLARAEILLSENGYARAAGPFAGGLNEHEGRRYIVTLRAGQDYRIVGVCDNRCRDLDLRLRDPNDREIAQDVLEDSVPVIHVRPYATGQHAIDVEMQGCAGAPCWFAFNVYSR
jgi:hypothetical protein